MAVRPILFALPRASPTGRAWGASKANKITSKTHTHFFSARVRGGQVAGDATVTITRECFDRVAGLARDAGMDIYLLGNTQYGLSMQIDDNLTPFCNTTHTTKPYQVQVCACVACPAQRM